MARAKKKEQAEKADEKPAKGKKQAEPQQKLSLLDAITQAHGAEAVVSFRGERRKYDVVSTGSLTLDRAIGIGGYPRGRIVEIYGPQAAGKTTLCLTAVANAQALGMKCLYVDAEHAVDVKYAEALGVRFDGESFLLSQPSCGEEAIDIAVTGAKSGDLGIVVVDSVAALTPRAEIEGEAGDQKVGLHARLMSQTMRRMVAVCSQHNVLAIFINQLRMKIGVMFGSPETTTGGEALKYFSSLRLDVRRIGMVGTKEDNRGNRTRVKVAKNKMAPPFREAEFNIEFGQGIDREGEVVELGVELGVIEKSGSRLKFGGEEVGNGLAAATAALKSDPELCRKIEVAMGIVEA